ncbi:MAG: potassium channel family protein [Bacteroidaceae bacterium]|nr:potassium channel family protein [Bacteroidaceae bacterium]
MTKAEKFKEQLARVFDSDLRTKQWENYADYAIIGLIVISTIEVFLSTYDGIVEKYGKLLHFVDYFTTICFTIEVSLRIWAADQITPKYKGFWGRIRYCLSFYGLIDILSTFPFYLNLFVQVPYMALKVLRIARLLRVFRYVKAFNILSRAIKAKRQEMGVSLQFLAIVTLILSFILFFVEHNAQPEVYDNGWKSVVWAFAQYIGDPGGFADTPPITFTGRLIACVIGVLGIAIFAVPAGLIGSAFTEVMEKDSNDEELKNNSRRINEFMLVKSIKRAGVFFPAKNMSIGDLQLELGLSDAEIIKAVSNSKNLRLKNLANAISSGPKTDMIVVNQFHVNTQYGSYINRDSSVTIVNPLGKGDNGLSYFDWHIAQIGGFNYVANELFSRTHSNINSRCNFYTVDEPDNQSFRAFIDDITRGKDKNDWIVVIAGEQIVKNSPYDFHFELGGERGETSFDFDECIPWNRNLTKQLYEDFSKTLEETVQLKTDLHSVQPKVGRNNLARYLTTQTEANVLLLTISYDLMVFKKNIYEAVINVADVLNRNLETRKPQGVHFEEYSVRPIESQYWRRLYLPEED